VGKKKWSIGKGVTGKGTQRQDWLRYRDARPTYAGYLWGLVSRWMRLFFLCGQFASFCWCRRAYL